MTVGIIYYGAGNLQSVLNAFKAVGADTCVVSSPEDTRALTHLVLPGQGEFGDCATKLMASGMSEAIIQWIHSDKPFLGICVGYQLLFEQSEENPDIPGLGILRGTCKKFSQPKLKVPHMGWNSVSVTDATHPLWQGLEANPYFYYVHSYFPICAEPDAIACTTEYGDIFHGAVTRGKMVATQFHPEKSQHAGLQFLKNFLSL